MTAHTRRDCSGTGPDPSRPPTGVRWLATALVLGAFALALLLLPAVAAWTGTANLLAQDKLPQVQPLPSPERPQEVVGKSKEDKQAIPSQPDDKGEPATVEKAEKAL